MDGKPLKSLRAFAFTCTLGLVAIGCSSGSDADTAVLGTDETVEESTSTAAPETTAAPTTTQAPETAATEEETAAPETTAEPAAAEATEDESNLAVLTSFLDALDAQDYDTLLGSLHPDYAASISPDGVTKWSAFWVFQALFDYDALEEPDCSVGVATISCSQAVDDRLARSLDYEFTTTIVATFEDGLIRTAALSSSDEDFFIPLLTWAFSQSETLCTSDPQGPYEGMTDEEIAAARSESLTEFDPDVPLVASMISSVDCMVDNVGVFAALPDSPPLPSR